MKPKLRPRSGSGVITGVLVFTVFIRVGLAQPGAGDGLLPGTRFDPQTESEAAQRGALLFRTSCGFCHGAEARGGQGPDLTQSARINVDSDGTALAAYLKEGAPAAGMPPFPTMTARDAADINAFVRSKGVERRAPFDPSSIVVGDAAAGRAYFNGEGGCSGCHSATGDLRGVGSRYDPFVLQGRMLNPRAVGAGRGASSDLPPVTARVTLAGGEVITGEVVLVNDFFVTLIETSGHRRTIVRDNDEPRVELDDPLEAHRQHLMKWTDANMHNVTAYLVSLK